MPSNLKADQPDSMAQANALLAANVDITGAFAAEVVTAKNPAGNVLWVNVNGICVLRICRVKHLSVNGEEQP